ncbi:MAG: CAP domain-containing protein [Pseudomonadota bacterium]|nr:CAP domain-containing protein [Pseudomonadota bacterium]
MPNVTALVAAVAISLSATVATACNLPPNAASLMADAGSALNAARTDNGRDALRRDARLDRAAQRHACWMSTNGSFSHRGAGNSGPRDRIAATGYQASMTSENIAEGQPSGQQVMSDWMRSQGHRDNILRGEAKDYGVGVALLSGRVLWVMLYAAQR